MMDKKPDRLLADEEILNALNEKPFDCVKHISLTEGYCDELRELAKAQDAKTASIVRQEIVEWGDERCPHSEGIDYPIPAHLHKRHCDKCWEKLKRKWGEI